MTTPKTLSRNLALLLAFVTFAAPIAAQHKPAPPKAPLEKKEPVSPPKGATKTPGEQAPVTIDNLLAADSYKIYGEVKNVGTLVRSGGIAELIDPIMKLADPPKEFKALIKFLNANGDTLADSRLVFATWPARAGVPNVFVVIELASTEDAVKFEPKLNRVLPTILPTPVPTPAEEKTTTDGQPPASSKEPTTRSGQKSDRNSTSDQGVAAEAKAKPPEPPPFVVSRSGNLIFVTDKPFKFDRLRPADSKLLNDDQNFRQAHERFSTEPVFIYVNVALKDRSRPQPSPEPTTDEVEEARIKAEEEANERKAAEMTPDEPARPEPENSQPEPRIEGTATLVAGDPRPTGVVVLGSAEPSPPSQPQPQIIAFGSLLSLTTGGQPEWPDAIGIAIAQESDEYVIRSILIGPQNGKRLILPFVPQLLAGRTHAPNASSILPADTEILVSASVDFPRSYREMLARLEANNKERIAEMHRLPAAHRNDKEEKPYDPFSEFEKKAGFKINEELLPALGNEIALGGSLKSLGGAGVLGINVSPPPSAKPTADSTESDQEKTQKQLDEQAGPMLLISVRDRETARRLMPKVLDGLGVGLAKMVGTTVKREDTEMVDFAGALAYGFVGDFLVISTTPAVRHLIDSYLNHQTLASNSAFRDFTRWQPREVIGQVYVSPALMEGYQKAAHDPSQKIGAAMQEYLLRLSPTPQAITYALSNEGFGSIHELHLPKSLVLATVAGTASATKEPPPEMNEAVVRGLLRMIASAEATYKETSGKGSYGSLDNLIEAKLISSMEVFDKYGYRIDVTISGNQFEASATPVEYGKTGRLSYFVDGSGVVRGADHGGGPATAADRPIQ